MATIVAVGIHKGGTGKTTTTINLSAALASSGFRVCAVDMDPQAQVALGLRTQVRADRTIVDVLFDQVPVKDVVVRGEGSSFDLVPSHASLSGADTDLEKEMDGWHALQRALAPLAEDYDYIVIDTPPELGMLNANALGAASHVVIPVETQQAAYDQLPPYVDFVVRAQKKLNPRLRVLGLLPTKFAKRQLLDEQIVSFLRGNKWGFHVFTPIRRSTKIAESFAVGIPAISHDADAASGYVTLAEEVVAATRVGLPVLSPAEAS